MPNYLDSITPLVDNTSIATLKLPILCERFINDGFGILEGTQNEVEYWINQFNLLRETIKIGKLPYGTPI